MGVEHPNVLEPPCQASPQSCSQLAPNCTSHKLNPLTVNKGPCPTQEADDMDAMVLPQRHARPRQAYFDGAQKDGWMTDRTRRNPTAQAPNANSTTTAATPQSHPTLLAAQASPPTC